MKKIKDLIEIPDVETVIQVSSITECDETSRKRRFVDTFVITDDIMEGLHAVFASLKRDSGLGFLLKGGYGSGKSHFIAFITTILLHPHLAANLRIIKDELASHITTCASRPILPVVLALTDYPASSSLSDIVSNAISESLAYSALPNPIAETAGIADDFARIMLPGLKSTFDEYCEKHKITQFDSLPEAEKNTLILRFLKDYNVPFRPHYDYRELFGRIDSIASRKFPGGIFVFVDELSEFLRARSRPELISEDIRFIQFLGEHAARSNFRILFSMQEAIEEVVDITAEGLNRVKDRYPVRINLTVFHLRELVEKRLLLKKDGAYPIIDGIHASLCDSFPQLNISKEEFRAIYPIHPATFAMLESIAGLFSKTRGLVDFIVTEIAGNFSRNIAGILDHPAEKLLLPDRIFDHFRNNLQESIQYNRMVSVIFNAVERTAFSHFKKENDARVALRAAKLIVLHQILPNKKSPSALELANLLIENRFQIDPNINYTFIREKIMKGLEQIWPFLRCERGVASLEDRFYLTGEESPLNRFEKSALQFLQTVPHAEKQALLFFISRIHDNEIPLAEFKTGERTARLQFENTAREGIVLLKDPISFSGQDIDTLKIKLTRSELDFVIIIGLPYQENNDRERFREICGSIPPPFCDTVFYWKPRTPNDRERQALKNYFARLRVAESGNIPIEDKSVREHIEESKREGFRITKSLYAEGEVYSFFDGAIKQHELLFTQGFDKTTELFVRDAIKRAFPSHAKIMPTVPISSTETYHQIILLFREKSEIDFNFEGSKLLKNAVDSILKNSGILSIFQSQYKISPDPSKNSFVKDLLNSIENTSCSFEELYVHFRKGKYGIQKELFILYLFFLSASGYLTLKRSGRVMRPSSLDLRSIQTSDQILPGEELSALFVEKFPLLGHFAEGLKPKNIHLQAQEAVWDRLVAFKRLEEDRYTSLFQKLDNLERFPIFAKNPLAKVRTSLNNIIVFLKNIKTGRSAKDGLNELLSQLPVDGNIEVDLEITKRFEQFLQVSSDQIIFIYNYLTSPELFLGENEELKAELMRLTARLKEIDALISAGMVESFIQNFIAFREEYKRFYSIAHAKIHPVGAFDEYENIRLTPAYRVLANLHLIEPITIPHDIVFVERTLSALHQSICRRSVEKELNENPYCACRLRREDIHLSLNDIRTMIQKGIEEYFKALHSEEYAGKIANFCGALLSSGESEKRDSLKLLLETDPSQTANTDLLRIVSREVAILCNRALSTNIQIIEKRTEEILSLFEGRRGSRGDLVRMFCDWLDRDIPEGKEILYHFTQTKAAKKTIIPPIALEAIRKIFPGRNEETLSKAIALSFLPPKPESHQPHFLISKLLHLEMSGESIKNFIETHSDFISPSFEWESLFDEKEISELISLLQLEDKSTEDLAALFNSSAGFPTIRTEIIAWLLNTTITLARKDESLFKIDDSIHGHLLASVLSLRAAQKNFLRESSRSDEFNELLFHWAFEAILEAEKLRQISLNRNISPEKIASPALIIKNDIEDSCAKIFSEKNAKWENNKTSVSAIHDFLRAAHKPIIFLFDALRYDLFLAIKQMFEKAGWKHKKTSIYLSPLPSDTQAFREALFPKIDLESGLQFTHEENSFIFLSAAERDYKRDELVSLLKGNPEATLILSIGILDEKIHGTSQSTESIASEIGLFCEQTIFPIISDSTFTHDIVIMNDHGFIENRNYAQKSEPRYSHGGNSFQERIVYTARFIKS